MTTTKKKGRQNFSTKKKELSLFIIAFVPGRKQILLQIFERFSTRRTNEEEQPSAGFERGKSTRARKEGRKECFVAPRTLRRSNAPRRTKKRSSTSTNSPVDFPTHSWGKRWKRTRTSSTRSTRTNDICSNTDTRRKQRNPSKRWKDCCRGRRWEKETRRKAPRKRKMSNVGCPSLSSQKEL